MHLVLMFKLKIWSMVNPMNVGWIYMAVKPGGDEKL